MEGITIDELDPVETPSRFHALATRLDVEDGKLTVEQVLSCLTREDLEGLLFSSDTAFDPTITNLLSGETAQEAIDELAGRVAMIGNLHKVTTYDAAHLPPGGKHTYNPLSRSAFIIGWGATGGGGGAESTAASSPGIGGGGGEGGEVWHFISSLAVIIEATLTIGAAGTSAPGVAGTSAGSSIYYDGVNNLTINGGGGGDTSGTSGIRGSVGGQGGTASGGNVLNRKGADGDTGLVAGTAINAVPFAQGGKGANGPQGGRILGTGSVAANGISAAGPRQGGSGAARVVSSGTGTATGGLGRSATWIIMEYS